MAETAVAGATPATPRADPNGPSAGLGTPRGRAR
jgi:hypothetical protein